MTVSPATGRLTVTDPPIPEDEGLILPPGVQGSDVEMAVVVELGADVKLPLQAGDRVYFLAQHFAKIDDVRIVDEGAIVAFEKR